MSIQQYVMIPSADADGTDSVARAEIVSVGKLFAAKWRLSHPNSQNDFAANPDLVVGESMKTIAPVMHSFAYALNYLREQVADVAESDMVAQPNGVQNHPAWVVGHLTFVCQMLGSVIGLPRWLPDDWSARFGPGSEPVAESNGYEMKDKALAMLVDAEERFSRAVEQLDESRLDEVFPVESYRSVFPTIRHALTQVLVGHTAYHVGQVGVWRKAMGMPPMSRSFD